MHVPSPSAEKGRARTATRHRASWRECPVAETGIDMGRTALLRDRCGRCGRAGARPFREDRVP